MSEGVVYTIGLLSVAAAGCIVGWIIGCNAVGFAYRNEAITNGYAIYHPQTGEFTWKCDLEKTSEPSR